MWLQVPGVALFAKGLTSQQQPASKALGASMTGQKFRTELDADDIRVVNELGQQSADALMDHIRGLQNTAYQVTHTHLPSPLPSTLPLSPFQLGIEEAKQLSRGKFLQVLEKPSTKW